jgi:hypothetical protein
MFEIITLHTGIVLPTGFEPTALSESERYNTVINSFVVQIALPVLHCPKAVTASML